MRKKRGTLDDLDCPVPITTDKHDSSKLMNRMSSSAV